MRGSSDFYMNKVIEPDVSDDALVLLVELPLDDRHSLCCLRVRPCRAPEPDALNLPKLFEHLPDGLLCRRARKIANENGAPLLLFVADFVL